MDEAVPQNDIVSAFALSVQDAQDLQSLIEKTVGEIKQARKRMERDHREIRALQKETRAIIEQIKAAV